MSTRKLAVAALFLLFFIVPIIQVSAASESFTVYTDKPQYMIGGTVNIYVKANYIDPGNTITVTDIVVTDPYGATVAAWHGLSIVLTDTTTPKLAGTLTATSVGTYTISATAFGCTTLLKAAGYFTVAGDDVPEVPFGTIAAAAALIAATGLYLTRKKYTTKK
jgi:hypothetical protein